VVLLTGRGCGEARPLRAAPSIERNDAWSPPPAASGPSPLANTNLTDAFVPE